MAACLSAIIYFHMPNILQNVLDASSLLYLKQNVRFRGTIHSEIF